MVAHASNFCNAAAVVTSMPPSTRTRRTAPSSAVAPRSRAPLATTSRNKSGNGKKARTTTTAAGRRRRCVEVIRRKIEALRRLVPSGGDGDADDGGVDELLFRAADYIVRLQVQVKAMQLMVDVLEHTKDS